MIRIIKKQNVYYGVEFSELEEEYENFENHIKEGNPVIVVNSLDDLVNIDLLIDATEIVMLD